MFTSLLPGVRHVRAPLAAGLLWLLGIWLLVADYLPPTGRATGGLRTLIHLGDKAGRVSVGIAVVFIAYLVGTAAAQLFGRFTGDFSRLIQLFRGLPPFETESVVSTDPGTLFTSTAERSIRAAAREELGDIRARAMTAEVDVDDVVRRTEDFPEWEDWDLFKSEYPRPWDRWEYVIERAQKRSVYQFDLLATRLMTTQPQLFAELDRYRAEAELRYQLFLPLLFVDIALAVAWTPWLLFAVPFLAFLFVQGMHSAQRAGDIVADAVLSGQVTPPAVERVQRITDDLIQSKLSARAPG